MLEQKQQFTQVCNIHNTGELQLGLHVSQSLERSNGINSNPLTSLCLTGNSISTPSKGTCKLQHTNKAAYKASTSRPKGSPLKTAIIVYYIIKYLE